MTKSKIIGAIATSAILLQLLSQSTTKNNEDNLIKYEPVQDPSMVTIASRQQGKELYCGIVTNGFSDIVVHSAKAIRQNVNVPNVEYLNLDCQLDNNPTDKYENTYILDQHKEECGDMFHFSADDLVNFNLYLCDKCFDIQSPNHINDSAKVQQYYHTMNYGYPEENIYPVSNIVNHESLGYRSLSELER